MKLLEENSILKNLPLLTAKELLIFDSIRFAAEMIEHSYEKLMIDLNEISNGNPHRNVPATFGYAWSIIDNSVRLSNLCKKLPWENEREILGHLFYLKDFRHTYQHLEDRIEESLLETETPFFGVISWFYKFPNSKFEFYQLVSGVLIHGPNAKQTVPKIEDCKIGVNTILLHSVNRNAESMETDLTVAMHNLKGLFKELERRLNLHCQENNLEPRDLSKLKDVILHFKQPDN